jgi:pilus assembly protein CpaB
MFLLKPKFVITLAVVTGLLASYAVYRYLKQTEAQSPDSNLPTFVSQRVVVASVDLPLGTMLTPAEIQIRMFPENLVPIGTFGTVEELDGRVLRTAVAMGEPILESKLAPEGSGGGFTGLIPAGMRAVTVGVNVVSGVGGFILPQTKVDVLVTVSGTGKGSDRETRTILQNVEVLAVDQTYVTDSDDPRQVRSVTLLVTPEEAEKLTLAANEGVLQLALRSASDEELHKSDGVALKELMRKNQPPPAPRKPAPQPVVKKEPPPPPPPEPVVKTVEIIRPNKREEVQFEEMPAESSNALRSSE